MTESLAYTRPVPVSWGTSLATFHEVEDPATIGLGLRPASDDDDDDNPIETRDQIIKFYNKFRINEFVLKSYCKF